MTEAVNPLFALDSFQNALRFDANSGVKGSIKRLEKQLKEVEPETSEVQELESEQPALEEKQPDLSEVLDENNS